jgi:Mg-chelatase subunit ChlD
MRYRYSQWSGDGDSEVDPDVVIDALADELAGGDVEEVLRRVQSSGLTTPSGDRLPGLQELIERIDDERASILSSDSYAELLSALEAMKSDEPATPPDITPRDETHGAREGDEAAGSDAGASLSGGSESLTAFDAASSETGTEHEVDATTGGMAPARAASAAQSHATRVRAVLASARPAGAPSTGAPSNVSGGTYFPATGDPIARLTALLAQASASPSGAESVPSGLGAVAAGTRRAGEARSTTACAESPGVSVIQEARDLLARLTDLENTRQALSAAAEGGELDGLDLEALRHTLGDDAAEACARWIGLRSALESSGYLRHSSERWTLTARAVHRIGARLVDRIFARLGRGPRGEHETGRIGHGPDPADESKRYEYGDRMILDVKATVMNALYRAGPGVPLRLAADDFEVQRSLERTSSTTVLLLDTSRSMPLRGYFVGGRKVAIALSALLRERFPRDRLHVLAFGAGVETIDPLALPAVNSVHGAHGTNVQAALAAARRLLGASRSQTRQIILITDGEPTAHTETDGLRLAYPPVQATLQHTLREVQRCTRDGIVINTFMLGRTATAIDFVETVARLNGGRAFFASPDRLDEYVILDYITSHSNT